MEFNDLKQALFNSPDLRGLPETMQAVLLWRGAEEIVGSMEVVYAEGTSLDDTFCLLLSGAVQVEKAGRVLGEIQESQIFGEMAYFSPRHDRTATVRAGPAGATVLKFHLTLEELGSAPFSPLKRYLGMQAWDRFVSNSNYAL
jgi:CRP-like cAMP-binding protein